MRHCGEVFIIVAFILLENCGGSGMQTGICPITHPDNLWEIVEICRRYTTRSDADIDLLIDVARNIGLVANLTGCDIFIEAMLENGIDSIVLAWGTPGESVSLYRSSVVGEVAYAISEPAVFRTMRTGIPSRNVRGISQEGIPIAQTVVPIRNAVDEVIGALIMERNIEAEIKEERQVALLSQTAERLSSTLMHLSMTDVSFKNWMGNGIFVLDEKGKIIFANAEATELFRSLTGEVALASDFGSVYPHLTNIDELMEYISEEREIRTPRKIYELKGHGLVHEGKASGCVISVRDITDLRMKEKELDMKSTIIAEIHHRVKNNLQNIAALLRMQARRTDSQMVRDEFTSSINRIISIALAYDVFARQPMESVDCVEMIRGVVTSLTDSLGQSGKHFTCRVSGDQVRIPHAQAVPLALVANELATNSIKHAVSKLNDGLIDIFVKASSRSIMMCVKDNGTDDIEVAASACRRSLGLDIVRKLAQDQLAGRFTLARHKGKTYAVLSFARNSLML
jgi:two-component sensor histidine kinase